MYLFPSGSADRPAPVMGHQWRRFLLVHCQPSGSPGPEQERQKRWAELFEQLDLNKDGRIDIAELQTGLSGQGLSKGSAEKVCQRSKPFVVHVGELWELSVPTDGTSLAGAFMVGSWILG